MVKKYSLKADGKTSLSAHFKVREFKCKDGTDEILIEEDLIKKLETLFAILNCKYITIVSGYRTPTHDKRVGGKGKGSHVEGKAADIKCYDSKGHAILSSRVAKTCENMGIMGIGMNSGGNKYSTHIDVNYRATKWYGDESVSMTKSIWQIRKNCNSFYTYC